MYCDKTKEVELLNLFSGESFWRLILQFVYKKISTIFVNHLDFMDCHQNPKVSSFISITCIFYLMLIELFRPNPMNKIQSKKGCNPDCAKH
jgi:hypothetical protein